MELGTKYLKLRIAYIVPSLRPLGPVIVVRNLVEQMTAHGHKCVVFYFDECDDKMTFACKTRQISFWKRLDFSDFDWVHAHSFRPMVYASRLKGVRKMTTMHSYLFEEYNYSLGSFFGKILGRYTMFVASKFEKVVVLSENAREYYSRWIPKEKLVVCYNGVTINANNVNSQDNHSGDWRRIEKFKVDGILVGCICELAKIKNLDTMIHALRLLPEQYKLLLIGAGKEKDALDSLANKTGIGERILFLGERVEAHRFLPLIDVFAMTSRSEGFCLALTEAALYGRNIVCADIPGMREKYSEEEVTYFDPDSAQELANAILAAQKSGEKAEQAKAVAEERFSTERMYEAYARVYECVQRV